MVLTIGYWTGIRGKYEDIRLLLEHTGEKYDFEEWDSKNANEWFSKKFSMPLPFPNLPYMIDGNVKLTQLQAIRQYLGRKFELAAVSETEQQEQGVIDGVLAEIRERWTGLMYASKNFETDKDSYETQTLRPLLRQLDHWLADKEYLVANRLTYSDFVFYELVDINLALIPRILAEFPNVSKLHQQIGNLPAVKAFLESNRAPKAINGGPTNWCNEY